MNITITITSIYILTSSIKIKLDVNNIDSELVSEISSYIFINNIIESFDIIILYYVKNVNIITQICSYI